MTSPLQTFSDQLALVDRAVSQVERKWGIGRLRLLVSEATRARFDVAAAMWRKAVADCQASPVLAAPLLEHLKACAGMMGRAWAALEAEATQACAAPISPEWWEVQPDEPERGVVCITRTLEEAHVLHAQARAEGRLVEVWALEEVARVIKAHNIVAAIKAGFPGATVTPSGRIRTEGQEIGMTPLVEDEIPDFGDPTP